LDAGTITQDEYDTRMSEMETRITEMVESTAAVNRGGHDAGGIMKEYQIVSDLTGLEADAVKEAREGGQSLADIAAEYDVDEDTLIAAIMEDFAARLQEQLDAGTITQDEYDTRMSEMETRITEMVESTAAVNRGGHDAGGIMKEYQIVSDLTGLEADAVKEAREGGQSLADIAAEYDVDEDTLIAAIMEDFAARLQEQLDAGTITQDEYDTRLSEMETRITEMVESTNAVPQGGPGNGPGGPGRPGRPNNSSGNSQTTDFKASSFK
jgi:transposase-like protein